MGLKRPEKGGRFNDIVSNETSCVYLGKSSGKLKVEIPKDCGTPMTVKLRRSLLLAHNRYRSRAARGKYTIKAKKSALKKLPTAARMLVLKYNCSLEQTAMKWANQAQCQMTHSDYDVGENLYAVSGTSTSLESAAEVRSNLTVSPNSLDDKSFHQSATEPWVEEINQFGISSALTQRPGIGHATQGPPLTNKSLVHSGWESFSPSTECERQTVVTGRLTNTPRHITWFMMLIGSKKKATAYAGIEAHSRGPVSVENNMRGSSMLRKRRHRGASRRIVKDSNVAKTRTATLNVGTLIGRSCELGAALQRRRIDLCAVQEIRWSGNKSREIGCGFKIIYNGSPSTRNGVGVIVSERFRNSVAEVQRYDDRLMKIVVATVERRLHFFSAYAPQTGCSDKAKDDFWTLLETEEVPPKDTIIVAGDLNGHVGATNDLELQTQAWSDRLAQFGPRLNVKKTEYLTTDVNEDGTIKVNGIDLARTETFKYLGSTVASDSSLSREVSARANSAWMKWRSVTGVLSTSTSQSASNRRFTKRSYVLSLFMALSVGQLPRK
ncbi:hypothetical protein Y032_0967g3238 [Ancylostoma ceylanicum]|uniref:SCP domain-containing protein n=1 Tax=Ancylostoma ceylanicum TaxID=53326 RepID=A0A016W7N1_9BILA|nr:hypothetical protein Y032_0967g3238 [Ancylostoma ceylanicum]